MTDDRYALTLASSGKLKLRAKALLADGSADAIFTASVLLHEAARAQRRATELLPECPPLTRLTSAVEECACLVEALDPPGAADAWGDVLRSKDGLDAKAVRAVVSRLGPKYESLHGAFARAVAASPALLAMRNARTIDGLTAAERSTARKELAVVLATFPGVTSFWWLGYRLAEAEDDKSAAWDALRRARELEPNNPRFRAMSLLVAAWALPLAAAERHLESARGSLERSEAELCLMYAVAQISLARKASEADRKRRWRHARDAADIGVARATTGGLRKDLRAVQLVLRELLAGRKPTIDVLYLAGLGELASIAKTNENIVDLLTTRFRRESERERAA